jgi:hypothetical protein
LRFDISFGKPFFIFKGEQMGHKIANLLAIIPGVIFVMAGLGAFLPPNQAWASGLSLVAAGLWFFKPIRTYVFGLLPARMNTVRFALSIGFLLFLTSFVLIPAPKHHARPSTNDSVSAVVTPQPPASTQVIPSTPTEGNTHMAPAPSTPPALTKPPVSYATPNGTDCSLIGKLAFNAADAYARGISRKRFAATTFKAFMASHPEYSNDQKGQDEAYQVIDLVFESSAKIGARLGIESSVAANSPPPENIRKHLSSIAVMQLSQCVQSDGRENETKAEFCVDSALTALSQGTIPFNESAGAFGKCGNGYSSVPER